jgi:hypothetical protein
MSVSIPCLVLPSIDLLVPESIGCLTLVSSNCLVQELVISNLHTRLPRSYVYKMLLDYIY